MGSGSLHVAASAKLKTSSKISSARNASGSNGDSVAAEPDMFRSYFAFVRRGHLYLSDGRS